MPLSLILDTKTITPHGLPSMCCNNSIEQPEYESRTLHQDIALARFELKEIIGLDKRC